MKEVRLIIVLAAFTFSCGMLKRGAIPWENKPISVPKSGAVATNGKSQPAAAISIAPAKIPASVKARKNKLDEAFRDWKGIPYVLGGSSYSGVDCSSFMQIVFEDYFGLKLPRNTKDQQKIGSSVKKNGIEIGDLIFFKTGRNTLHVGVAVSSNEFMHASTSSGVMISGLKERYWADAYLTTRRIFK